MAASIRNCFSRFGVLKSGFHQISLCKAPFKSNRPGYGCLLPIGCPPSSTATRQFCSSGSKLDISEFFDDPKNWGEETVKVGRSWTKDELRIKSNGDLHKLWYVLLKERNMLLTMEHAHEKECELMPNPERLDKVEDSMENLEDVVRERNKAYYELETAETGEAPTVDLVTPMGKMKNREIKEYPIPKHMNKKWKADQIHIDPKELVHFNAVLREKANKRRRQQRHRNERYVFNVLKRFPNVDEEAIKEQYPDVDIERCKMQLS